MGPKYDEVKINTKMATDNGKLMTFLFNLKIIYVLLIKFLSPAIWLQMDRGEVENCSVV